jgi:hypothetical protein
MQNFQHTPSLYLIWATMTSLVSLASTIIFLVVALRAMRAHERLAESVAAMATRQSPS